MNSEGPRSSEAAALDLSDVNLERGAVNLDENKTDDPRTWAHDPGVTAAGIDRATLFEKSKSRQPIRLHDARATFITIALANRRSESWVQDRTGHHSSIMINRCRRAAHMAAELGLGELSSLATAIPDT